MNLRRFLQGFLPKFSGGSLIQWSLALVVSLVLWVAAMGGRNFTFTLQLAVVAPDVPAEYIVLEGPVSDSVRVTFSGEGIGGLRDQITNTPTALAWSWSQTAAGESYPHRVEHEFTSRDIRYSGGGYSDIGIVSFSPQSVTVTLDRQLTRTLPVRATATGELPARYYWAELSDDSVEVVGAATVLSEMDNCLTVPVQPETRSTGTGFTLPDGLASVHPASITVRLIPPVPVVAPGRITTAGKLY